MQFDTNFLPLEITQVHTLAERLKRDGWRYVQMLAVNNDQSVDIVYSYMLDGKLDNYVIKDVPYETTLDSISDLYLESFVCENEIHDLFGITFDGLAIDFLGNFYKLANEKPMTIISPEQAAARKKAAASKEKKASKPNSETDINKASANNKDDDMEAKLAAMDPEKAAKVRAAMEAKAKKANKKATDSGKEA